MKTLNLIVGLLIAYSASVFAAGDLTPAQEKAQRSLYANLHKEKNEPTVDTSYNSI